MTKHLSSYTSEHALCGVAYTLATDDVAAESIEECDCLECFRSVMRSDTGFFKEYVNRTFEQEWRPRFVKLIRGAPGFAGDETFTQVLDKVIERLVPADESLGQPMLLGSIPVVSTPGWPEGTVTLVNTRDLDDLADRPATLLGDVPLFRSVVLPKGKRACVQSREPGLMVLVAYDDWSTELLPAQTLCYLLEKT